MLVLKRKIGEEIVIGDNVHITIVAIRGEKVRIGIVAPKEVSVDRREIHDKRLTALGTNPVPQASAATDAHVIAPAIEDQSAPNVDSHKVVVAHNPLRQRVGPKRRPGKSGLFR
jgi:carbon storage regulator